VSCGAHYSGRPFKEALMPREIRHRLLVALACCTGLIGLGGLRVEAQTPSARLAVRVPKNLALLHVLVLLTPSGAERRAFIDHALADAARDYFAPYAGHRAVAATEQLFRAAWYHPLNYAALHYSEFPGAKQIHAFPARLTGSGGDWEARLSQYMSLADEFYGVSRFEEFWEAHQEEIQAVVAQARQSMVARDLPGLMERLYGRHVQQFVLAPCPFMQESGAHVEVEAANDTTFYYLAGGEIPSDAFRYTYVAFHEFSHSFIEPISARYGEQIGALSDLYRPLAVRFRQLGYNDWDRAFNEHMVTAGQILLAGLVLGQDRVEELLRHEEQNGFQLIRRFYRLFLTYGANRDAYPDLEAFYPAILRELRTLGAEEYRAPGTMGFFPVVGAERVTIDSVIGGSAFALAGIVAGDVLLRLGGTDVGSEAAFQAAKERWWSSASEGDTVDVEVLRLGSRVAIRVPVPFVTRFRYVGRAPRGHREGG
jgi:hypothetical protein